MLMFYVPGGVFLMGSTEVEIDAALALCKRQAWQADCERSRFEDEAPLHAVTLDGFWIDRNEVTYAQYALCVSNGGCTQEMGMDYVGHNYAQGGVTWQRAADYCAWAGGRLPTEAEWEYAARGPRGVTYPWGDEFDGARLNYRDEGLYAEGAPVGSFPGGASWCGALDMAGNVWEWVGDWYDDNYYARVPSHNPTGPVSGESRVLRGGSWDNEFSHLRSAGRFHLHPGSWTPNIGFRCVVAED
jgi:formylglycine-generating enzyme required for sulfatase activity